MSEVIGRIEHLMVHPVKSAGAIEVPTVRLTPEGLEGDREFMIVRAIPDSTGVHDFLTQRDKRSRVEKGPQSMRILSLIKPQYVNGELVLTWQGKEPIHVPSDLDRGEERAVRIHGNEYHGAVDQGDLLAQWLSDHLNLPVRLVKAAGSFHRRANQNYVPNPNEIGMQDGYPVLWFSRRSVEELSKVAGFDDDTPFPWQSFRPNVVIDGTQPSIEHEVLAGEISGIPFANAKPCDRCPVTNVDQNTGDLVIGRATTPLSTYKNWRNIRGERKVIFGENMLPEGEGQVSVGDEVVLIDRRNPPLKYGAKLKAL